MKKIHIILKHTVVGGLFVSLMCSCTNYEKKAQEFISKSHLEEKIVFRKLSDSPYGVLYIGEFGACFHDLKNDSDKLVIEQKGIVKWSSTQTGDSNISIMTLSDSYGKVSDLSYGYGAINASTKLEGYVNIDEIGKKYVFTDSNGSRTAYDSVTGVCKHIKSIGDYLTDHQIYENRIYKIYDSPNRNCLFYDEPGVIFNSTFRYYDALSGREAEYENCCLVFGETTDHMSLIVSIKSEGFYLLKKIDTYTGVATQITKGSSISPYQGGYLVKQYDLTEEYYDGNGNKAPKPTSQFLESLIDLFL